MNRANFHQGPWRMIAPLLLVALTTAAAVLWTVNVILVPAEIRRSLDENLGRFFPGGLTFGRAERLGPRCYRVADLEALDPATDAPWFTARSLEVEMSGDGASLSRLRLWRPTLRLKKGPAFLPPDAFRVPPGSGKLPRVEVMQGDIAGLLPGGDGVLVVWAQQVNFVMDPGEGSTARGTFETPLGRFSVRGVVNPSGTSHLRAKAESVDLEGLGGALGSAGPPVLHGKAAGAFSFAFGGGASPLLAGSLALESVELAGAGVFLDAVRLVVKGSSSGPSWNTRLHVLAKQARWDRIVLENVELVLPPDAGGRAHGSAELWSGTLEIEGAANPAYEGRGTLRDADLSRVPPGLLGSATPTGGTLDAEFTLGNGRLAGTFRARDAALWGIRFLSGIRDKVPVFGRSQNVFSSVEGRIVHLGRSTLVPELSLLGSGFRLDLLKTGRIGPARALDLLFELRLHRQRPRGLPPLRTVFEAFEKALWKGLGKYFLLKIHVKGTLDAPVNRLLPPGSVGEGK